MDFTQGSNIVILLRQACTDLDFKDKNKTTALIKTLESTAQVLSQSELSRCVITAHCSALPSQINRHQAGEDLKLWVYLRKLWRDLARTQLSFWDNDDSSDDEGGGDNENTLRTVCTHLARFTRNLVAGVPENQLRA